MNCHALLGQLWPAHHRALGAPRAQAATIASIGPSAIAHESTPVNRRRRALIDSPLQILCHRIEYLLITEDDNFSSGSAADNSRFHGACADSVNLTSLSA